MKAISQVRGAVAVSNITPVELHLGVFLPTSHGCPLKCKYLSGVKSSEVDRVSAFVCAP